MPVPAMPTPPMPASGAGDSAGPGVDVTAADAGPEPEVPRDAPVETAQRSGTLAARIAARLQPRRTAELVDGEPGASERNFGGPNAAALHELSDTEQLDAQLEEERAGVLMAHAVAAEAAAASVAAGHSGAGKKRRAANRAAASGSADEALRAVAEHSASQRKTPAKRSRALQPLDGNAPADASARKVTRGMAKVAATGAPAAARAPVARVAAVVTAAPKGKGGSAAPVARKRQEVLDSSDDDFVAGATERF